MKKCLQENVLADFLRKSKAEVKAVCIYEYDAERRGFLTGRKGMRMAVQMDRKRNERDVFIF